MVSSLVRGIRGSARSRLFVMLGVSLLTLALVACGGDDGNADSPSDNPTAAAAAEGSSNDSNNVDAGGSVTAEFLSRFFGLPPSFVTDSERACMDAELAPDFPNGLPADATFTEELVDKLDTAAETCNVAGLGS